MPETYKYFAKVVKFTNSGHTVDDDPTNDRTQERILTNVQLFLRRRGQFLYGALQLNLSFAQFLTHELQKLRWYYRRFTSYGIHC